jgi:hypothetical protein
VLAHLIATGDHDRHLRLVRARQRRRRDAVLAALRIHLPAVRVAGIAAGLHLLVELPDGTEVAARARAVGVGVQPLSWHQVAPAAPASSWATPPTPPTASTKPYAASPRSSPDPDRPPIDRRDAEGPAARPGRDTGTAAMPGRPGRPDGRDARTAGTPGGPGRPGYRTAGTPGRPGHPDGRDTRTAGTPGRPGCRDGPAGGPWRNAAVEDLRRLRPHDHLA